MKKQKQTVEQKLKIENEVLSYELQELRDEVVDLKSDVEYYSRYEAAHNERIEKTMKYRAVDLALKVVRFALDRLDRVRFKLSRIRIKLVFKKAEMKHLPALAEEQKEAAAPAVAIP